MNDIDIRRSLRSNPQKLIGSDKNSLIIEELGLCQGEARIDFAVVKSRIHGFEIKSERDNLNRLPLQVEIYSRTFDKVTLIVGSKHLIKAIEIVPHWWGIIEAKSIDKRIFFSEYREHQDNPSLDPEAIVQFIWREEAYNILRERNLHKGLKRKSKWSLWDRLIETLTLDELRNEVISTLVSRKDWRSDLQLV